MLKKIISPKATVAAVLLLLIIVSVAYFLWWRLPETAYDNALKQVELLRTITQDTTATMKNIKSPVGLEREFLTAQQANIKSYQSVVDSLSSDVVVRRDPQVASVFNESKDKLLSYSSAVNDELSSIDSYLTILESCTAVIEKLSSITNVNDFDTASQACNDVIELSDSTADTSFKQQYLNGYLPLARDLLAAYRKKIAGESGKTVATTIETLNRHITELRTKELSITAPNLSSTLDKLDSITRSQKTTLLR